MDAQQIINWLLGVFGMVLGFMLRAIWQSVKDLQKSDKEIVEKVNSIEVLVAGGYVPKSEFDKRVDALFDKLDRIEDKLDKKEDKT